MNNGSDAGGERTDATTDTEDEPSVETLREQVEQKYDFDDFGPEDMAQMTPEEWDAAFDIDTWITGPELLDRVERDVKQRIADRDVFARLERVSHPDRLIAFSDEGYAVVYENGTINGEGTVLRDVKPSVALCSMDDYDVPEPIEGSVLPHPDEVTEGSGTLGHRLLQVVGGVLVLMGIVLFGAGVIGLLGEAGIIGIVFGLVFIVIGLVMFLLVANARLSDRFRAEEYRDRLRDIGAGGDRPDALDEIAEHTDTLPEQGDLDNQRDDDSNVTPPRL